MPLVSGVWLCCAVGRPTLCGSAAFVTGSTERGASSRQLNGSAHALASREVTQIVSAECAGAGFRSYLYAPGCVFRLRAVSADGARTAGYCARPQLCASQSFCDRMCPWAQLRMTAIPAAPLP